MPWPTPLAGRGFKALLLYKEVWRISQKQRRDARASDQIVAGTNARPRPMHSTTVGPSCESISCRRIERRLPARCRRASPQLLDDDLAPSCDSFFATFRAQPDVVGHRQVGGEFNPRPPFGDRLIEARDLVARVAIGTDEREWGPMFGVTAHISIPEQEAEGARKIPPAGPVPASGAATQATGSGCKACKYSTALEACDAAEKMARLSFRRTEIQFSM